MTLLVFFCFGNLGTADENPKTFPIHFLAIVLGAAIQLLHRNWFKEERNVLFTC